MLDPGFAPGWTLGAVVEGLRGDCDYAQRLADGWRVRPWWRQRNFPAETGTGAGFSVSIGRRRLVRAVRPELSLEGLAARCGVRFN